MLKMVVLAKAIPGKKDELAKWYDERHLGDLLAVDGVASVERHDYMPLKGPEGLPQWDFLLIYEFEGNDPIAVLGNMAKAQIALSEIMESSQTLSVIATSRTKLG
jgi:hypothetical protein